MLICDLEQEVYTKLLAKELPWHGRKGTALEALGRKNDKRLTS